MSTAHTVEHSILIQRYNMSTAAASSSKPMQQYKKKPDPVSDSESDYSDSSEDVTEDEDGVDLTPALDAAILRTLAKIRNKRGVYEGENVLENELKEAEEKVIKAGIKAMPNRREEIKVSWVDGSKRYMQLTIAEVYTGGPSSRCSPKWPSRRR